MSKRTGWYKSDDAMQKHPCIRHHESKELCLAGKHGQIWPNGEHYKAVIWSSGVASRYTDKEVERGSECIVSFSKEELDRWVKLLKVSPNRKTQLRYAEGPGKFIVCKREKKV